MSKLGKLYEYCQNCCSSTQRARCYFDDYGNHFCSAECKEDYLENEVIGMPVINELN